MHHHQQTLRDLEPMDQPSAGEILIYLAILILGIAALIFFLFSF